MERALEKETVEMFVQREKSLEESQRMQRWGQKKVEGGGR